MNSPRNPLREINLGALTCVLLCLLCGQARADESEPVKSLLELRQRDVTVQKWDLSCGAAALATILNYQYGDRITEREVALGLMKREEYLDNPKVVQLREGFSLLDLKRFVDGRGYLGIGLGKLDFMDLIDRAPIMVPIRTNGYNHFVVFRGIARNRVLLADPAWGNRTLLKGDFLKMWIDYPVIGHVGFVVAKADGELSDPKALAPTGNDFVFLR